MDRLKVANARKQQELRRLILEQKTKTTVNTKTTKELVNSPLAKYDSAGNLSCIICQSNVKSATVWKVHVNSKQHKEKVEAAKKLKDELLTAPLTKKIKTIQPAQTTTNVKKPTHEVKHHAPVQEITKNQLPIGFFDDIKEGKINVEKPPIISTQTSTTTITAAVNEVNDDPLPEKFFDDPIKDAKIRNIEYKDPMDEEWNRFQQEIKVASTTSNAIIAGEQDLLANARILEEIDEQMARWSRVIDLEQKKECVLQKLKLNGKDKIDIKEEEISSEDENTDFDEFSNWRSKNFSTK